MANQSARFWLVSLIGLLLVNAISAFAVVSTTYQSRQLHAGMNESIKQKVQLDEEYGRLLLEKNTWISPAEIELVASQKLKMRAPAIDQTVVIDR